MATAGITMILQDCVMDNISTVQKLTWCYGKDMALMKQFNTGTNRARRHARNFP